MMKELKKELPNNLSAAESICLQNMYYMQFLFNCMGSHIIAWGRLLYDMVIHDD